MFQFKGTTKIFFFFCNLSLKCKRDADSSEMRTLCWVTWFGLFPPSNSEATLLEISRDNNVTLSHRVLLQILNYKKEDQMTTASNTGVSRRHGGLWSRKSNYLCIYISHIVITSLIVPPLSPPFPAPLIISSFIQTNKHTIGALWIQRICFPLSKSRYSLMIGQRQTSK